MDDTPTMKDLNRHIVSKYAARWKDIGRELGLDSHELITVDKNHHNQIEEGIRELLHKWMNTISNATWEKLLVALKKLDLDPIDSLYDSGHGKCTCEL